MVCITECIWKKKGARNFAARYKQVVDFDEVQN
jgi:hypothetical protein